MAWAVSRKLPVTTQRKLASRSRTNCCWVLGSGSATITVGKLDDIPINSPLLWQASQTGCAADRPPLVLPCSPHDGREDSMRVVSLMYHVLSRSGHNTYPLSAKLCNDSPIIPLGLVELAPLW